MTRDMTSTTARAEIEHGYGSRVHILNDAFLLTLLARIGHPNTSSRELRGLLRSIYQRLLGSALAAELPTVDARVPTRMSSETDRGHYEGPIIDPGTEVVIACLVRAGVLPSEICYETLIEVVDPGGVRLDYLSMSRQVDERGCVVGTDESGLKIGGPLRDKILLIPDPMGATGGTVRRVLDIYEERDLGPAQKTIVVPMIATPEFLRSLAENHPRVIVYTGRLDRGMSSPEVLARTPGTVEGEHGLDERQYIVPGAGGIGEVLTNSWV
ncbi:MAG: uracil phosphoribosyltransferase, partial [Planctomycetota bacterium]